MTVCVKCHINLRWHIPYEDVDGNTYCYECFFVDENSKDREVES